MPQKGLVEVDRLAEVLDLDRRSVEHWLSLTEETLTRAEGGGQHHAREVTRLLYKHGDELADLATKSTHSAVGIAVGLVSADLLARSSAGVISAETKEEEYYQAEYAGRIVLELIQNLHDAVAHRVDVPPIGQFGLGIKGMSSVVDAIRLRSGELSLSFDPGLIVEVRPDLRVFESLPLFLYPFPMPPQAAVPPTADFKGPGLGLIEWNGRTWLWSQHHGKTFSPGDADGFRRRHNSSKDDDWRRERSGSGATTIWFRLAASDETIEQVQKKLEELPPDLLLFLPALGGLELDVQGRNSTLKIEDVESQDDIRIVETKPGDKWWLHVRGEYEFELRDKIVRSNRGLAIPLGVDDEGLKQVLDRGLISWFPINEVCPGLPFLLHDSGLQLSNDREQLQPSHINRERLEALGEWAAARVIDVCRDVPRNNPGIADLLKRLYRDLPRRILPANPERAVLFPRGDRQHVPQTATDAARYLAAVFTRAVREPKFGEPPLLTGHEASTPLAATSVLWTSSADLELARAASHDLNMAAEGRGLLDPDAVAYIEREHLDPGHDVPEIDEPFFPGMRTLDHQLLLDALDRLGGRLLEQGCVSVDRLVPFDARRAETAEALALLELLQRKPPHESTTPGRLPIPVKQIPVEKEAVESILLPGANLHGLEATLRSAGYLIAEVPEHLHVLLRGFGVVQPDWVDILDGLHSRSEENELDDEEAAEIWRLACVAIRELDGASALSSSSVHPLVESALVYESLDVKQLVRPWEDHGQFSAWAGEDRFHIRTALSRLRVPTRAGQLRAVGELSLAERVPPGLELPTSLLVDLDAVARWMGDADVETVRGVLRVAGAWPGVPLVVRCRRMRTVEFDDVVFERAIDQWTDLPSGWLRTLPRKKFRETTVEGRRRKLPEGLQRLPYRSEACLPDARLKTAHGGAWYASAGHHKTDQVAVLVDVPEEWRDGERLSSPNVARAVLAMLCDQPSERHRDALTWTWHVNTNPWRGGRRYWDLRISAAGDIPSPLLHRLRNTPFLEPDRSEVEWLWPNGKMAPANATYWPLAHLQRWPTRFFPVAKLSGRDGEPEASVLALARPPQDLRGTNKHLSDPRWILATLVRMARAWEKRMQRCEDVAYPSPEDLATLVSRLLSHLGAALRMSGEPEKKSMPHSSAVWPETYERPEGGADDEACALLGHWFADTVEAGFLKIDERPAEWPFLVRDNPLDFTALIPLFVLDESGGSFHNLAELRQGRNVVAADQPAWRQKVIAQRLGLIAFPTGSIKLARALRLPLFVMGDPPMAKTAPRPPWAESLERATARMLPWLIRAAGDAGQNVNVDVLDSRLGDQLQWRYLDSLEQRVPLLGFPGELWIEGADQRLFQCLSKARESRKGGDRAMAVIAVEAGQEEEVLQSRLAELAPEMAEAMGLTGGAVLVALEYVLYRCSTPDAWEALTSRNERLPAGLRRFLHEKGWLIEAAGLDAAYLHSAVQKLLEALELPNFAPLPDGDESSDSFLASAFEKRWSETGSRAVTSAMKRSVEDSVVPTEIVAVIATMESVPAERLRAALVRSELRLDLLMNGHPIAPAWRGLSDALEPYLSVLVRREALEGDVLDLLSDDEAHLRLLPDEAALRAVMATQLTSAFTNQAISDDFTSALTDGSNELQHILDDIFRRHGVLLPDQRERRKAAWRRALVTAAHTVRGAAALSLIDPIHQFLEEVHRFYLWRQSSATLINQVLERMDDFPPVSLEGASQLFEIELEPRERSVDEQSDREIVDFLVELADAKHPGRVATLVEEVRRPIKILNESFKSREAAEAALGERRGDLDNLEPEMLSSEILPPDGSELDNSSGSSASSKGKRTGRPMRFSARASLIGREGELYLKTKLECGLCFPPGLKAETLAVLDVSLPERVAVARQNPHLRDWAGEDELDANPGFDLLWIHRRDSGQVCADGIEVKASVDPRNDEVTINWTENEHNAAHGIKSNGAWPIDGYRICCVTRLWRLDSAGQLLSPQVTWLSDPARLEQERLIDVERVPAPVTYTVRAGFGKGRS